MAEKKTLGDIADLISTPVEAETVDADPEVEEDAPIVGESDEAELDDADQEDIFDDADEADEDEDPDTGDEEEDDAEADADGDGPGKPVLEVNESDVIEVMIDGELEYRTIGEAMQALSGEGAIDKRLKEATEERKAAHAERTEWTRQREVQTQSLVNAFNALSETVFTPRVPEPDQELRTKNPQQYLIQQDDYKREVDRLQALQQNVQGLFGQIQQEVLDGEKEFRVEQQKILAEKLPILRDKKVGKAQQKMILDAAEHYGFSPQEITAASDHRLFLMAYDAAQYRAGKKKQSETKVELGKQKRKIPRTIRAGAVSKAKSRALSNKKRQDAVKAKAKKTGKVDDVVNFITS